MTSPPGAIVWLEGLGKLKNLITTSRIEPTMYKNFVVRTDGFSQLVCSQHSGGFALYRMPLDKELETLRTSFT
jgi:hypothetical protein